MFLSSSGQLSFTGVLQHRLQDHPTAGQRQQLSGPHPVLPGRAGSPQQPHQEEQDIYDESKCEPVLNNTVLIQHLKQPHKTRFWEQLCATRSTVEDIYQFQVFKFTKLRTLEGLDLPL